MSVKNEGKSTSTRFDRVLMDIAINEAHKRVDELLKDCNIIEVMAVESWLWKKFQEIKPWKHDQCGHGDFNDMQLILNVSHGAVAKCKHCGELFLTMKLLDANKKAVKELNNRHWGKSKEPVSTGKDNDTIKEK